MADVRLTCGPVPRHAPRTSLAWCGWLLAVFATVPLLVADEPAGPKSSFTQSPQVLPVEGATAPPTPQPTLSPRDLESRPVPQWIWGADPQVNYVFSKTFAGGTRSARLRATCDNEMTIYLNGRKLASSDSWQNPVDVDLQPHLKTGENELVVEARNQGGVAAFICDIALQPPEGAARYVVTDETWKSGPSRREPAKGAVKSIAKLGAEPWGDVFAGEGAAPRDLFRLPPGFQIERLFTVPKEEAGSWVCLTVDDRGRLIASDQDKKGLYRITPPAIGGSESTKVERIPVDITSAQGLLCAFGSLYVCVNGGPGSGLYRVRDTDKDDQYDELVKLRVIDGGGEHGPHALRLAPDGQSIYVICGNHTRPPFPAGEEKTNPNYSSRIPTNWAEDHILPRMWDANGHARGILAPGGWIAKTDPEGKTWEVFSMGYRNPYDMAFNSDGELFAYDADMEWDFGSPWYRPTRVGHSTSGSEFGWRSGTGKWPAYYVDSLPAMIDIGPGSPVGVEFGYGAKFPAKYQKALFICDWTFGTMYALHLQPEGATYTATKEEFVTRSPLPLTDVVIGRDGAMYFTIGGRGTQSELFRVTYTGSESTQPVDARTVQGAEMRDLRHKLESYHRPLTDAAAAIDFAWKHLSHPDRFIRYAARIALEQQETALWQDRLFAEKNPEAIITGAVAVARQGDKGLQDRLLDALGRLEWSKLTEFQQLELLRAYQLSCTRMGEPRGEVRQSLVARFDPLFPSKSDFINRELCNLLIYWKSPTIVSKLITLLQQPDRATSDADIMDLVQRNKGYGATLLSMFKNRSDEQKIAYAFALRNVKEGWTLEQRKVYFDFLARARSWSGGASFKGFLRNMDVESFEGATEKERLAIESTGARKADTPPQLPVPKGPGREWTMETVVQAAGDGLKKGRDFKNGQAMFSAARCVLCHRFGGEGGATGPDLTQLAGRFTLKDLTEAIIDPNKVISDQYRASSIMTQDGKVYTGRVVSETDNTVIIVINPEDSTKVAELRKADIEEQKVSTVSLMPKDLLNTLNETEVLDLLAYLLSRGNSGDPMFRK